MQGEVAQREAAKSTAQRTGIQSAIQSAFGGTTSPTFSVMETTVPSLMWDNSYSSLL